MSNVVIIDLCDSQSSSSTNPLEYSQSEFLLCDSRKRKTKDRNEGSDTNVILLDDSGNEKFDALVPPESQKAFTKSDRSEKQASKKRAKQDEKELAQKEKEEEKLNKKLEKGDRWWAEIACILPGDDSFGPLVQERLNKGWQSATDKECIEKFSYFTDYECKFAGLYRWTWRSTIRGGCCDLLADPSPRILQHACFIFPARNFLDLVIKKDDYKNFGPLSKFMHELQTSMIKDGKCPQGTRLVVLLENVHKHYSKCVAARNSSGHGHKLDSLILAARFDQAVAFLTYDLSIDVVVCEDQESLCSQIAIMHRSLGLMLYKAPATNLDCIQKKKSIGEGDEALKVTWQNMVLQITGMSTVRAKSMIDDNRFGCPKALYDTLSGDSNGLESLARVFGKKTYKKLANDVFGVITSKDPTHLID